MVDGKVITSWEYNIFYISLPGGPERQFLAERYVLAPSGHIWFLDYSSGATVRLAEYIVEEACWGPKPDGIEDPACRVLLREGPYADGGR